MKTYINDIAVKRCNQSHHTQTCTLCILFYCILLDPFRVLLCWVCENEGSCVGRLRHEIKIKIKIKIQYQKRTSITSPVGGSKAAIRVITLRLAHLPRALASKTRLVVGAGGER